MTADDNQSLEQTGANSKKRDNLEDRPWEKGEKESDTQPMIDEVENSDDPEIKRDESVQAMSCERASASSASNPASSAPTGDDGADSKKPPRESIGKTFGMVAILSFMSKFLGLARDMVILGAFGRAADPFYFASMFTGNILVLFGGLGGPFHSTAVSVLSSRKEAPETKALVARLLVLTFSALSLLCLLLWIFAPQIVPLILQADQLSEMEQQSLWGEVVLLLRIMSPLVVIAGLVGVGAGISNSYKEYFWPSLAPAVANVAVIALVLSWLFLAGSSDFELGRTAGAALAFAQSLALNTSNSANALVECCKLFVWIPLGGLLFLSAGALAGAIGQLFVQLPGIMRSRPDFRSLARPHPGTKEFLIMLGPAAIATTVGQLNVWIDASFVSNLEKGSMAAITNANRLLQLPLGVLLTAMLVPILPRFTEQVAAGEIDDMKKELSRSLRIVWFLVIPLVTMLLAIPGPIIRLLFERGQFDSKLGELIVLALAFLVPQAFFYIPRDLVTRAFFAHQDSATPFKVGLAAIAVKYMANYVLVIVLGLGVGGITLSTTLVTIFNMTLLSLLLRRKIGPLGITRLVKPAAIMLLSALLAGVIAHFSQLAIISHLPSQGTLAKTISLVISIAVSGVLALSLYALVCLLFKLEEPKLALAKIKQSSLYKRLKSS